MTRLGPTVLILGVCGALGISRSAAAQPAACRPVTDAMLRVAMTPHHTVSITGSQTETITVGHTAYVRINGVWHRSASSPQDQLQQEQDNVKNAKIYTCTHLRSERVNRISALAYRVHSDTPDVGTADGTLGIAASLDLPVRLDEDFTPMMGPKKHAVTWDYANVHAPVVGR